jgi:hypothetical protein
MQGATGERILFKRVLEVEADPVLANVGLEVRRLEHAARDGDEDQNSTKMGKATRSDS